MDKTGGKTENQLERRACKGPGRQWRMRDWRSGTVTNGEVSCWTHAIIMPLEDKSIKSYMNSLDIESLSSNVALIKIFQICLDNLFRLILMISLLGLLLGNGTDFCY